MKKIDNFTMPSEILKYKQDTGGQTKKPRGIAVVNAFIEGSDEGDNLYKTANDHAVTEQWFDNYYIFLYLLLKKCKLRREDIVLDDSHLKQGGFYSPNKASRKRAFEASNAVIRSLINGEQAILDKFVSDSSDPNITYPDSGNVKSSDSLSGKRKPYMANFYWIIKLLNEKGVSIYISDDMTTSGERDNSVDADDGHIPTCLELENLYRSNFNPGQEIEENRLFDLYEEYTEKDLASNWRSKLKGKCFI